MQILCEQRNWCAKIIATAVSFIPANLIALQKQSRNQKLHHE